MSEGSGTRAPVGEREVHRAFLHGRPPTHVPGLQIDIVPGSDDSASYFFEFYQPAEHLVEFCLGSVEGELGVVTAAVKGAITRFALPLHTTFTHERGEGWHEDLLSPKEVMSHMRQWAEERLPGIFERVNLLYGRFDTHRSQFRYASWGERSALYYDHKAKRSYPLPAAQKEERELFFSIGDLFLFWPGDLHAMSSSIETVVEERGAEEFSTWGKQVGTTHSLIGFRAVKPTESRKVMRAAFTNELSQLDAVREFVAKACADIPGDAQAVSERLQLAVNEAFANITKHSYKNEAGRKIEIWAEAIDEGVVIELTDQGSSFEPGAAAFPDLSGDKEGGFGLYLMGKLCDRISYVPKNSPDGWNRLRFYQGYRLEGGIMELSCEMHEGTLVIRIDSETLDASRSQSFKQQIMDAIEQYQTRQLIFDLSKLQFIDSSGLGAFLSVLRHVHSQEGDLKLAQMSSPVKTMFQIVRMHKLFEIYDTVEHALQAFSKPILKEGE